METTEIVTELKSRGERDIIFNEDGLIISHHGDFTTNYWVIKEGQLHCVDTKNIMLEFDSADRKRINNKNNRVKLSINEK